MRTVGRWAVVLLIAVACAETEELEDSSQVVGEARLSLTSPAFEEGDNVPTEFTCKGNDTSPSLEWSGVPEEAAELELTLIDPDAPSGTFVHWVVTGIDPATTGVRAGEVPDGGTEEENSFGETAYGGPCPPPGPPHTYTWSLNAVSVDGQVIASGVLTAEFGT